MSHSEQGSPAPDDPRRGQGEITEPEAAAGGRGRLLIALVAALSLIALIGVIVATGSSDEGAEVSDNECIVAWNENPVATQTDGIHAYTSHGYRETLVTRVDSEGELIDEAAAGDEPEGRCVVVFAAPRLDREPDYSARVFEDDRWTGLIFTDRLPVDDLEAMQREALVRANATLEADGFISEG